MFQLQCLNFLFVFECVRWCKNTNSKDKVTCLACKHATVAHISTPNIFFVSDDTVSLGPELRKECGGNADVILTTHENKLYPSTAPTLLPVINKIQHLHICVPYLFLFVFLLGNTKL